MSFQYPYHIQFSVKNTTLRNVMNMRMHDREAAITAFKRDFGVENYIVERCFIPSPADIKNGISLIKPKVEREPEEWKPFWCNCCVHTTNHTFAGYNLPINEGLEEPLVALYTCNLCETKLEVWLI